MINEVLIPAVTDHTVTYVERDLLGLPVCMGGLGFTDPVVTSSSEYEASIKVTNPLVRRIVEKVCPGLVPWASMHGNFIQY